MSIEYPEALPVGMLLPLRAGYGYQGTGQSLRTTLGRGQLARQWYSDAPDRYRVAIIMTPAQWAYFQAWHRYTLKSNAEWFFMRLQAAGTVDSREVRLLTQPSYALSGAVGGVVSATLESRVASGVSEDVWESIKAYGSIEALVAAMQARENTINDTLASTE